MTTAAALLAYAVLLVAAAPVLARAAWPDRAPRLGIAAWLALSGSAVVSVVLGGAALLVSMAGVSEAMARLLADCVMTLRADCEQPGCALLAGGGAALAAAVIARLAWSTTLTLAVRARAGRGHRRRLRLAGRADPRLGAIVLDHDVPAAWCLPGAGRPVVLTTAAIQVLDGPQVAAVLAHEKAHQSGRHHLLAALAAALAAAFPWVPAFRLAREEVARLAELAADDAAACVAPRLAVAGALLTLAAAPAGALGAGGATAARIRRMIAAPDPLSHAAAAGAALAVVVLAAAPLAMLAGLVAVTLAGSCCPHLAAVIPCSSGMCPVRVC